MHLGGWKERVKHEFVFFANMHSLPCTHDALDSTCSTLSYSAILIEAEVKSCGEYRIFDVDERHRTV